MDTLIHFIEGHPLFSFILLWSICAVGLAYAIGESDLEKEKEKILNRK